MATQEGPVSFDVNKATAAVGTEVRKLMRQGARPTTPRARRAENLATLQRLGVIGEEEAKSLADILDELGTGPIIVSPTVPGPLTGPVLPTGPVPIGRLRTLQESTANPFVKVATEVLLAAAELQPQPQVAAKPQSTGKQPLQPQATAKMQPEEETAAASDSIIDEALSGAAYGAALGAGVGATAGGIFWGGVYSGVAFSAGGGPAGGAFAGGVGGALGAGSGAAWGFVIGGALGAAGGAAYGAVKNYTENAVPKR